LAFLTISAFPGPTLQAFEFGLCWIFRGPAKPDQIEVFLIEAFIFALALLSLSFLPFTPSFSTGFFVFFVFVDNEAFSDLGSNSC
jgi:hypothetical protein